MVEEYTYQLNMLYQALNAKFQVPDPLCPFDDTVHEYQEIQDCLNEVAESRGSDSEITIDGLHMVAKCLYGGDSTLPQLIYLSGVCCGYNSLFREENINWIEAATEKLYCSITDSSLSDLYKELEQANRPPLNRKDHSAFKLQVNKQWPNFFTAPQGPAMITFTVYVFDDISEPEFALNHETISIHKKLEEVPAHTYPKPIGYSQIARE